MDRRHRGVPGGSEGPDPLEHVCRSEARRAHDAPPTRQRGEQRGHETVDVEQRHHVEAPVVRREGERPRDIAGRSRQIPVRQRNELRTARRPGGVQEERDLVRRGRARAPRIVSRSRDVERARSGDIRRGVELDDRNVERTRHVSRGSVEVAPDHDGRRFEIAEVEVELLARIGRVQRRAHRGGDRPEERDRHGGAVRDHDGDTIAAPDPAPPEHRHVGLDLGVELSVREWRGAGREQSRPRDRRRCACGRDTLPQDAGEKREPGPCAFCAGRHVCIIPTTHCPGLDEPCEQTLDQIVVTDPAVVRSVVAQCGASSN